MTKKKAKCTKKEEKKENKNILQVSNKEREKDENIDLFVDKIYNNQKENSNENIYINTTGNKDKRKNEQINLYEKELMLNLHKTNMRRTTAQANQKSIIDLVGKSERELQSQNKKTLFPSDRNIDKE